MILYVHFEFHLNFTWIETFNFDIITNKIFDFRFSTQENHDLDYLLFVIWILKYKLGLVLKWKTKSVFERPWGEKILFFSYKNNFKTFKIKNNIILDYITCRRFKKYTILGHLNCHFDIIRINFLLISKCWASLSFFQNEWCVS